jgi:hypothetical protein
MILPPWSGVQRVDASNHHRRALRHLADRRPWDSYAASADRSRPPAVIPPNTPQRNPARTARPRRGTRYLARRAHLFRRILGHRCEEQRRIHPGWVGIE